jgi:hypothetical protein
MGFSRHTDRLFFAVCPNETTAAGIVDLAWDFRDDYALRGCHFFPSTSTQRFGMLETTSASG